MEEINNQKLRILFWRIDYYGALADGGMSSVIQGLIKEYLRAGHCVFHISGGKTNFSPEVTNYFVPFNKFFRNFPEVFSFPYQFKSVRITKKILKQLGNVNFIYKVIHDFNFSSAKVKNEFDYPLFVHADAVNYWIKKNWGKLYLSHLLRWAQEIEWIESDRIFTPSNLTKKQLIDFGAPKIK
jgi:hypothetical protein